MIIQLIRHIKKLYDAKQYKKAYDLATSCIEADPSIISDFQEYLDGMIKHGAQPLAYDKGLEAAVKDYKRTSK